MRILVHSSLAYSLVNFRGALLHALVAAGHDVIATAPDRDPEVEDRLASMGIVFVQIPMARAAISPLADLLILAAYIRLMWRYRPDAVLAYTQKPIIYGGLAARLFPRSRFHVIMSGLGYVFSAEADHRPRLRALVSLIYRAGVRSARTVFVFNADDRAAMLRHRIITHDHYVVQVPGSGIDIGHFVDQPLPEGPPAVLMVARLMRDKGVHDFVEAARIVRARSPDVRFRILGRLERDNPTAVSPDECRRWSDEGLIEFLPETRDVRPDLAACTLFALPSFYREGLPRTILEALASGRPVITTDLPGCRDAIVDGENGRLVPPRDPRRLADAILEMLADRPRLRAMAAAARRRAVTQYDVRDVNRALIGCMGLDTASPPRGSVGERPRAAKDSCPSS